MIRTFTSAIIVLGLLLISVPTWAQLAYNRMAVRSESVAESGPGEAPIAVSYKVIHGVVQGKEGALPGATVWLHGTRTIVVTNSEGEFELRVPTTIKEVKLTCGYGGLYEEVVTMAPVQALGSIYLLRNKVSGADQLEVK